MRYIAIDRWSRGDSPLHRLDARAKLAALLFLLGSLSATAPAGAVRTGLFFFLVTLLGCLAGKLPPATILKRSALVLPFTLTFAVISFWSGDQARAVALVIKMYLSASLVVLLMATTPLPKLLDGLHGLRVPALFIEVVHMLWRYLFVVHEQARHMRFAALARGGGFSFQAASGALAVLFARSHQRAEHIYRSMQARGHLGRLPVLRSSNFRLSDLMFITLCLGIALTAQLGVF